MLEKVEGQKERIGELLLKHTSLSEDQLAEALEIQQESGLLLGEILLKKHYIHPHDIIKVICHQVDIPYITEFKIDEVEEPSFIKMHVRYKSEIVHSGLRDPNYIDPTKETGKHLEPTEFAEMIDREDVVIVDVRSNYEHNVGRFKNAITFDIDDFRDLPSKINELAQYKDKKILTYCTGGIKCEKASALLLKEGFSEVYQLHGGIIKYGKEAGGKNFDGKCYVFDNRLTVDVNSVNPTIISKCYNCGKETLKVS